MDTVRRGNIESRAWSRFSSPTMVQAHFFLNHSYFIDERQMVLTVTFQHSVQ